MNYSQKAISVDTAFHVATAKIQWNRFPGVSLKVLKTKQSKTNYSLGSQWVPILYSRCYSHNWSLLSFCCHGDFLGDYILSTPSTVHCYKKKLIEISRSVTGLKIAFIVTIMRFIKRGKLTQIRILWKCNFTIISATRGVKLELWQNAGNFF